MRRARILVWRLVALLLASSLPAGAEAAKPTPGALGLRVGDCLARRGVAIQQIVSLELDRPVSLESGPAKGATLDQVTITCGVDELTLHYAAGAKHRQRSLDARSVAEAALTRTVALAVVELLEAPEGVEVRYAAPAYEERPAPSALPPNDATSTRAALLGTARVFLAHSDVTWGARLRSRVLSRQRGALLLGVGGEAGSAARAPGYISVTAAVAELGIGYELLRAGRFTLELDALSEGGYVVLRGRPRSVANAEGKQLTGAWAALQVAFSPRIRLTGALELTSRFGLGATLLAPAATFDSQHLDVFRGLSAVAGVGLAVAL